MTTPLKPHLSQTQKSKQAYKQRKEAKFIQRAKQLTKVARLKKKLGLNTDAATEKSSVEHRDTDIDRAVDITNTTTPAADTAAPAEQPSSRTDTKTPQQRHIIRNRIKQKMNSRTARGQPHLNLQMEVLYTKLLQQHNSNSAAG